MTVMIFGDINDANSWSKASRTNLFGDLQLVASLIGWLERYRRQPSSDVVPYLLDAEGARRVRPSSTRAAIPCTGR
jgi:hypothetical protein